MKKFDKQIKLNKLYEKRRAKEAANKTETAPIEETVEEPHQEEHEE
jgi:hypothetical protein